MFYGYFIKIDLLSDDLDISPDFFDYFLATYPVLNADLSLWCVSAWNDNGKAELVSDEPGNVYILNRFLPVAFA